MKSEALDGLQDRILHVAVPEEQSMARQLVEVGLTAHLRRASQAVASRWSVQKQIFGRRPGLVMDGDYPMRFAMRGSVAARRQRASII